VTRTDWIVSIYAGAAWGGVFWAVLPIATSLFQSDPRPNAALLTVATSIVLGIAGLVLFRVTAGTTSRRVGAAVSIGAFIGLPVLGWFALW
jgi:hypothetical protein